MTKPFAGQLIGLGLLASVAASGVAGLVCRQETPIVVEEVQKYSLEEALELTETKADYAEQLDEVAIFPDVFSDAEQHAKGYLKEFQEDYGSPSKVNVLAGLTIEYSIFLSNPDAYALIVDKANVALKHGLAYWKHMALQTPNVALEFPAKSEDLRTSATNDAVLVYAVKEKGFLYPFYYTAKYKNGFMDNQRFILKRKSLGGYVRSSEPSDDADAAKAEKIMWVIDEKDPLNFVIPAIEVLHWQLAGVEREKLNRLAQEGANEDAIRQYGEQTLLREEWFVHGGIQLSWLRQLNKDMGLGLTEEQIMRSDVNSWRRAYPAETSKADEYVKRVGIKTAIGEYVADSEGLFKKILQAP